jgi:hypothetical protein
VARIDLRKTSFKKELKKEKMDKIGGRKARTRVEGEEYSRRARSKRQSTPGELEVLIVISASVQVLARLLQFGKKKKEEKRKIKN